MLRMNYRLSLLIPPCPGYSDYGFCNFPVFRWMLGFHVTKHQDIKGFRGNGRTVACIINPGNKCRRVVTLQLLCPRGKSFRYSLNECAPVDLATVEKKKTILLPGIEHWTNSAIFSSNRLHLTRRREVERQLCDWRLSLKEIWQYHEMTGYSSVFWITVQLFGRRLSSTMPYSDASAKCACSRWLPTSTDFEWRTD
jgi:hypothetical protein